MRILEGVYHPGESACGGGVVIIHYANGHIERLALIHERSKENRHKQRQHHHTHNVYGIAENNLYLTLEYCNQRTCHHASAT